MSTARSRCVSQSSKAETPQGVAAGGSRSLMRQPSHKILERAAMTASSEWQPIGTAPLDGTAVLIASSFRVGESSYGVCRWQHDGFVANEGKPCWRAEDRQKRFPGTITHWMPLPSPPTAPAGGDNRREFVSFRFIRPLKYAPSTNGSWDEYFWSQDGWQWRDNVSQECAAEALEKTAEVYTRAAVPSRPAQDAHQ